MYLIVTLNLISKGLGEVGFNLVSEKSDDVAVIIGFVL
jgi:hypothetical protein